MRSTSTLRPTNPTKHRAITLAMIGLAAFTTLALAHEGATGVVKERMELMKRQQSDMKLIGDMAKGKTPFDAAKATLAASDVATTAKKIQDLFPQGSDGHPSDALPAIWKEWDRFTGNAKELETSADALGAVLAGGNDGWKPAFQKLTDSCKACHETYRAKDNGHEHH